MKIKLRIMIDEDICVKPFLEKIIDTIISGKTEFSKIDRIFTDTGKADIHILNFDKVRQVDNKGEKIYFYHKPLKIEKIGKIGGESAPIPLGIFCIEKFDQEKAEFSEIARFEQVIKNEFRRRLYEKTMEREITKDLNWKVQLNEDFFKNPASHVSLLSDPSMREVMIHSNMIVNKIKSESKAMISLRKSLEGNLKNLQNFTGAVGNDDINAFLTGLEAFNDERIKEKSLRRIPTIIIEGATGTGKTLMAKYLARKLLGDEHTKDYFSKVSTVNLSENIIDTELFGCIPGSYTGSNLQLGKILANYGGVFFLDEIGDAPLEVQTKLLTYIDDMIVPMTGYNKATPVKVPIVLIAATNRNLKEDIYEKKFREDLYHRFTYKIKLPDLKDRKDDFRFLLSFALQKAAGVKNSEKMKISIKAIEYLEKHNFPGNFRELESRCSKAIANAEIAGRDVLLKEDFEAY